MTETPERDLTVPVSTEIVPERVTVEIALAGTFRLGSTNGSTNGSTKIRIELRINRQSVLDEMPRLNIFDFIDPSSICLGLYGHIDGQSERRSGTFYS
jgi:hypothetical protein